MSSRMPEYRMDLVRSLRQRETSSEQMLWEQLRAGRLDGLKFRRQRPLGRYIADFCCDALKIIVEVDGGIHNMPEQQEYDAVRDATLIAHGYHVLRLSTEEVMDALPQALNKIRCTVQKCKPLENTLPSSPSPL